MPLVLERWIWSLWQRGQRNMEVVSKETGKGAQPVRSISRTTSSCCSPFFSIIGSWRQHAHPLIPKKAEKNHLRSEPSVKYSDYLIALKFVAPLN